MPVASRDIYEPKADDNLDRPVQLRRINGIQHRALASLVDVLGARASIGTPTFRAGKL